MSTARPDPELIAVGRQCLARKVRQASRNLTALYDEALRPHGLRTSQLNVLIAVGCRGAATPGDIGASLDLEKSTVSRNVERMVNSAWLTSEPSSTGRGVSYRLTRKGRGLLKRALPDWKSAEREARRQLGASGVAALDNLLQGLAARS